MCIQSSFGLQSDNKEKKNADEFPSGVVFYKLKSFQERNTIKMDYQ